MIQERTSEQLQAEYDAMENSPSDNGQVKMIVCRPDKGERTVLAEATFNIEVGLIGDNWLARGSRHTEDGTAHPGMQVAIMNSRVIELIAEDESRWQLAGDQLYLDLDLSAENLPVGQRIALGSVILEVTDVPHNGCGKFTERFGSGATRFVNSTAVRALRMRGVNTRVVQGGTLSVGDGVKKVYKD